MAKPTLSTYATRQKDWATITQTIDSEVIEEQYAKYRDMLQKIIDGEHVDTQMLGTVALILNKTSAKDLQQDLNTLYAYNEWLKTKAERTHTWSEVDEQIKKCENTMTKTNREYADQLKILKQQQGGAIPTKEQMDKQSALSDLFTKRYADAMSELHRLRAEKHKLNTASPPKEFLFDRLHITLPNGGKK
jgi:hypothetical protein